MICPKCGKDMMSGALGPSPKGVVFWAQESYFKSKICNFFTKKDAVKNGAILIPIGDGLTRNRTKAWACKECKYVLIDCN